MLMSEQSNPRTEKIENLELNKETLQDLTEQEGDQAKGGMPAAGGSKTYYSMWDGCYPKLTGNAVCVCDSNRYCC
jgi:hypothetical protein